MTRLKKSGEEIPIEEIVETGVDYSDQFQQWEKEVKTVRRSK
jgi:hypothetical protein